MICDILIIPENKLYTHHKTHYEVLLIMIVLEQANRPSDIYAMVRFRTIDLKSHPITQFEENRIICKKFLNSSKVNNKF